jgi:hypothetical protein
MVVVESPPMGERYEGVPRWWGRLPHWQKTLLQALMAIAFALLVAKAIWDTMGGGD